MKIQQTKNQRNEEKKMEKIENHITDSKNICIIYCTTIIIIITYKKMCMFALSMCVMLLTGQ